MTYMVQNKNEIINAYVIKPKGKVLRTSTNKFFYHGTTWGLNLET